MVTKLTYEMLRRSSNATGLYSTDVCRGKLPCQKGILTERLEIPPTKWVSVYAHVGGKNDGC